MRWDSWQKTQVFTFTSGFYRKPYSNPVFKFHTKIAKQELSCLFMHSFCRTERRGKKTRQKLESEKTQVYAQNPRLKKHFQNSTSLVLFYALFIVFITYIGLSSIPPPFSSFASSALLILLTLADFFMYKLAP